MLGGQLAVGATGIVGNLGTSIAGTLTAQVGPIVATRNGVLSDSLTRVGDLYPLVTLKWNQGVHNWMALGFGDIPVGAYDSRRLSNIGLGHGGIDGGAGYPYLNPTTGIEFSGVAGFTYNFKNPTPHNIKVASTSISTGVLRTFCPSSSSSAWSDMPTSRSACVNVEPPHCRS